MAYKAVLIDDNKNTVLSLEYSLEWENLGIELAGTAYDGRSGKELIEKTDPDIIISDINMPYLDGFTMVEESGKAEDRIIIVITGYDKFQYASRAIKLAVFDYILKPIDEAKSFRVYDRLEYIASGEDRFLRERGYRLNYYAITALLARVYLYAGKNAEAYAEAKKIIDEENETGYFKASTSSSGFRNGNMKMYNDIIFGLYSPKELVEWDQEINHGSDGSSEEHYLCLDSEVAKELYGDEKDSDWRFKYQLEEMYYGYYYRTLKYYKQTESTTVGITNNQTIPMIRMSEVYYIAAEAIFDTNPQEAQGYLELVKKGRGVSKKFDNVTNKSEFINLLVNDARREFLGEGQIFYMYKRLNRTMPASSYYSNPVLPTDENMILPKPDSESNI